MNIIPKIIQFKEGIMQSRMRVFVFILVLALLTPFACKQKEAELKIDYEKYCFGTDF